MEESFPRVFRIRPLGRRGSVVGRYEPLLLTLPGGSFKKKTSAWIILAARIFENFTHRHVPRYTGVFHNK